MFIAVVPAFMNLLAAILGKSDTNTNDLTNFFRAS